MENPFKIPDSERRAWRILQALTLVTIILSLGVSISVYRQGKSQHELELMTAVNRKQSCSMQRVIVGSTAQTAMEKSLQDYFASASSACHVSNAKN